MIAYNSGGQCYIALHYVALFLLLHRGKIA